MAGGNGRVKTMARYYITRRGVVDVVVFQAGVKAKPRGARRKGATPPRKQEANFRSAVRTSARMVNNNFEPGDLHITLKYKDMPEGGRAEWQHHLKLFLRRLSRAMAKEGRELKYWGATSNTDGDTGDEVRPHHHLIIPKVDWELVRSLWPYGWVDYQIMRDDKDYTRLVTYILKQVKGVADKAKYTASRNLVPPKVVEKEISYVGALKTPRGAEILEQYYKPEESAVQYCRYIKPESRPRRRNKTQIGEDDGHENQTGV